MPVAIDDEGDTVKVIVYSTPGCQKCNTLKDYLTEKRIAYTERDMQDPTVRGTLYSMNIFTNTAPVLEADGTYLDINELFCHGHLLKDTIDYYCGVDKGDMR